MIQRTPRWIWFVLLAVASTFAIVGIAIAVPKGGGNHARAAPAQVTSQPVRIALLGREVKVNFDQIVPICWVYNAYFDGPATEAHLVLARLQDGSEVPLFDKSGSPVRLGWKKVLSFVGPAGTALVIQPERPGPSEPVPAGCEKYL